MNIVIDVRSNIMAFANYFKKINEEWINTYFWMEESDIEILNNPQKNILDKGGNVFIALQNNKPVGTCALLVRDGITCELTKMAVDPAMHGQGIGYLLGQAFIQKARERGFKRIVLEGNDKMIASLALYHKLGFNEITYEFHVHDHTYHKRCNVFMELHLNPFQEPVYQI
jgi:GNAT superfamily N-acetyltransferase